MQQRLPFWDGLVRFGRQSAETLFATSPLLYYYISLAIDGNPIAVYFNSPFPPDPFATWGIYLELSPQPWLLSRFAIYNGNLSSRQNRFHGLDFSFRHPEGVMFIAEGTYRFQPKRLTGNYRIGAYYIIDADQVNRGGFKSQDYGLYCVFDQTIFQTQCTSLSCWLTAYTAPRDRNPISFFMSSGLVSKGLFPGRPDDVTCLGAAYGDFSSDFSQTEHTLDDAGIIGPLGIVPETYETLVELNHWLKISPAVALTPVIQWIRNPSMPKAGSNAAVLGVQFSAVL